MPPGSSRHQTLTYLQRRFEAAGIRPRVQYGQNFLIDLNLQRLILESADVGPDDVVLEVGTGTGALTLRLAERAHRVVTVEIDAALFQLAAESLAEMANVQMLEQDALKNKNQLHPRLVEALEAALAERPGLRLKLVANLPYSIATPLISNLLAAPPVPHKMTVTIQRELADRMMARPSTKDYSALSIWVQALARLELIRVMPPEAFWPRPKVQSAVLTITPDAALRARVPDVDYFHRFVRALFCHRRKFLRSVLVSMFKDELDKPQVDAVLAERGHGPTARAEELGIEPMIALAEAFRAVAPGWGGPRA